MEMVRISIEKLRMEIEEDGVPDDCEDMVVVENDSLNVPVRTNGNKSSEGHDQVVRNLM